MSNLPLKPFSPLVALEKRPTSPIRETAFSLEKSACGACRSEKREYTQE
jgi:hypothetical protein